MHMVDRKWFELSAGYQDIQSFKTKLEVEFGRAVRVGHKQQFRKELTEWQKKRRIFFALLAAAPLSIVALCITSFYFREVACVIIYWALLVVIILVTLAVAGRQYILEMVNGKPVPQPGEALVVDLEGSWWDGLSPLDLVDEKAGKKGMGNLRSFLAHSLPDSYIFYNLSPTNLLLLGPSGVWIIIIVDWSGLIVRESGIWKQIVTVHDKLGRRRHQEIAQEPGPDDQWLRRKDELQKLIELHFPERVGILNAIQGGVVFTNRKSTLNKTRIQGNTASYGTQKAWVDRIRNTSPQEDFTVEKQLLILDILAESRAAQNASAKNEAERLYRLAVEELRSYVEKMVK
jgi:hypothetical protein